MYQLERVKIPVRVEIYMYNSDRNIFGVRLRISFQQQKTQACTAVSLNVVWSIKH